MRAENNFYTMNIKNKKRIISISSVLLIIAVCAFAFPKFSQAVYQNLREVTISSSSLSSTGPTNNLVSITGQVSGSVYATDTTCYDSTGAITGTIVSYLESTSS